MPIRAIMFDLGNTLMYAKAPDMWPAVIQRGNRALMEHFCNLGIIKESDSLFDGFTNQGSHLLRVFGRSVSKTHPHTPETDCRNLKPTPSKFSLLHSISVGKILPYALS